VGIDYGNSYCRVGIWDAQRGTVEVLQIDGCQDEGGGSSALFPSWVSFSANGAAVDVGPVAKQRWARSFDSCTGEPHHQRRRRDTADEEGTVSDKFVHTCLLAGLKLHATESMGAPVVNALLAFTPDLRCTSTTADTKAGDVQQPDVFIINDEEEEEEEKEVEEGVVAGKDEDEGEVNFMDIDSAECRLAAAASTTMLDSSAAQCGLNIISSVSQAEAAVFAYGLEERMPGTLILVIDVGSRCLRLTLFNIPMKQQDEPEVRSGGLAEGRIGSPEDGSENEFDVQNQPTSIAASEEDEDVGVGGGYGAVQVGSGCWTGLGGQYVTSALFRFAAEQFQKFFGGAMLQLPKFSGRGGDSAAAAARGYGDETAIDMAREVLKQLALHRASVRLWAECERAKHALSGANCANFRMCLDALHGGIDFDLVLSRSRLEYLSSAIIMGVRQQLEGFVAAHAAYFTRLQRQQGRRLRGRKLARQRVECVLAGGGVQMPRMAQTVREALARAMSSCSGGGGTDDTADFINISGGGGDNCSSGGGGDSGGGSSSSSSVVEIEWELHNTLDPSLVTVHGVTRRLARLVDYHHAARHQAHIRGNVPSTTASASGSAKPGSSRSGGRRSVSDSFSDWLMGGPTVVKKKKNVAPAAGGRRERFREQQQRHQERVFRGFGSPTSSPSSSGGNGSGGNASQRAHPSHVRSASSANEQLLADFYSLHAPSKLLSVRDILRTYSLGHLEALLMEKYGESPTFVYDVLNTTSPEGAAQAAAFLTSHSDRFDPDRDDGLQQPSSPQQQRPGWRWWGEPDSGKYIYTSLKVLRFGEVSRDVRRSGGSLGRRRQMLYQEMLDKARIKFEEKVGKYKEATGMRFTLLEPDELMADESTDEDEDSEELTDDEDDELQGSGLVGRFKDAEEKEEQKCYDEKDVIEEGSWVGGGHACTEPRVVGERTDAGRSTHARRKARRKRKEQRGGCLPSSAPPSKSWWKRRQRAKKSKCIVIETAGLVKWAEFEVRITVREEGGLGKDALGNTIQLPPSVVAVVEQTDYWHTLRPTFSTVAGLIVGSAAFVGISVVTGGGVIPAFLSLPYLAASGGSFLAAKATQRGSKYMQGTMIENKAHANNGSGSGGGSGGRRSTSGRASSLLMLEQGASIPSGSLVSRRSRKGREQEGSEDEEEEETKDASDYFEEGIELIEDHLRMMEGDGRTEQREEGQQGLEGQHGLAMASGAEACSGASAGAGGGSSGSAAGANAAGGDEERGSRNPGTEAGHSGGSGNNSEDFEMIPLH
jgi:hypothetical protein